MIIRLPVAIMMMIMTMVMNVTTKMVMVMIMTIIVFKKNRYDSGDGSEDIIELVMKKRITTGGDDDIRLW